MGISFSVAKETIELFDGKVVVCYRIMYPDNFDRTPVVDPEMPEYGAIAPENPWDVSLSNVNALMVLRILGFMPEDHESLCGAIDPRKLMDACSEALGTVRDVPEIDHGTEPVVDGNWFYGGRRSGYLKDRLQQLSSLAAIALEREAVISFC